MNKETRNRLRSVVTQCRRLLEESVGSVLQGQFGIHPDGKVEGADGMGHLAEEDLQIREQLVASLEHIQASGFKPKPAVEQMVREIAFTHLNRLCAYKMMEARGLIREAVSRGLKSQGFMFYLAEHVEDEQLWSGGHQDVAYRHYLEWLGHRFSDEISVLFSPNDPANRLFPAQRVLDQILELVNGEDLAGIWEEDETIGWVYQYFTPDELRKQARKESSAPRNSYELAFRNQFYTPRYVVEFLTDNTLGRIWYEMRRGQTRLTDQCDYLVRRPCEVFLRDPNEYRPDQPKEWATKARNGDFTDIPEEGDWVDVGDLALAIDGYTESERLGLGDCLEFADQKIEEFDRSGRWPESAAELWLILFAYQRGVLRDRFPEEDSDEAKRIRSAYGALRQALQQETDDLSQEELLQRPVFVPYRALKDPRDLKILDPACGSGHFLLYAFDLLQTIYEEAWQGGTPASSETGRKLREDYEGLDALHRALPGLILRHNLHGIDIDLRAVQIAALALWLRTQRAYQEFGLTGADRPKITRSNIVCAEPMPGEKEMLEEFVKTLEPPPLRGLVREVWEKMEMAGEAGSLLKIEEEIRDAVERARVAWGKRPMAEQVTLFEGLDERGRPKVKQVELDFTGVRDELFFETAEQRILVALGEYGGLAEGTRSYKRRLFAEDSTAGIRFVELLRREFDVILMNPPFGESTPGARSYLKQSFPEGSSDIGMASVMRFAGKLSKAGVLGAITNRTCLATSNLEAWRRAVPLGPFPLTVIADLGYGVLDGAMVEAAAYVIANDPDRRAFMGVRLLDSLSKDDGLLEAIHALHMGQRDPRTQICRHQQFRDLPLAVIAYWAPRPLLRLLTATPGLGGAQPGANDGGHTGDDSRFVRATWEVPPGSIGIGKDFVFFAKGGEYAPMWDDIHLVAYWRDNGAAVREMPGARVYHEDLHFAPGLTYPLRTTSDLSPRVLPADCLFSTGGHGIHFRDLDDALVFLGLAYTRLYKVLVEALFGGGDASVSGSAARNYTAGTVNHLPLSEDITLRGRELVGVVRDLVCSYRDGYSDDETSRYFVAPSFVARGNELRAALTERLDDRLRRSGRMARSLERMERSVYAFAGVEGSDLRPVLDLVYGTHPCDYPKSDLPATAKDLLDLPLRDLVQAASQATGGCNRSVTKKSYFVDRKLDLLCHAMGRHPSSVVEWWLAARALPAGEVAEAADTLFSYALGCTFGRWDVRLPVDHSCRPPLPDVFHALPACPPGMLLGPDGLPAARRRIASVAWLRSRPDAVTLPVTRRVQGELTVAGEDASASGPAMAAEEDYPIDVDWDGILVDDPGHGDDIIGRVRAVLEVLWGDRGQAIEDEACEMLGENDLRSYFRRRTGKGFFMQHVKRYSKSRRKAPIYWLLRSAKGSYALWIYYHRLDKDIYFKALVNYVEPKVRLERNRLDELRAQRTAAGTGGAEVKRLEKEIGRQEQFVSELEDFEAKLRKVADLHLEPDLNDGVILNIAPLWELVPWKEPEKCWKRLLDGELEWSTVSQQLRERGVIKG